MSPEVATKIVSRGAGFLQPLQALGQEPRAEVLERGGRTVEQFECIERIGACLDPRVRGRQIECGIGDCSELGLQPVIVEEATECGAGDLGQADQAGKSGRVDRGQPGRHVQPAVWRQTAGDGLAQRNGGCAGACAEITQMRHQAFTTRAP